MNNFLIYVIQTMLLQLLFLFIFEFLFKKETFFKANRFYLLGSIILSLLIPLVKIPLKEDLQKQYVFQLKEIALSTTNLKESQIESTSTFSWITILYGVGFGVFLVFFLLKLIKIYKIKQQASVENLEKTKIYRVKNSNQAFSFLNYIFIGENNQNSAVIIEHEKVHQKQLHSVDLLFFECLKMVFWFNPMLYIYQKRIVEIHEFEADSYSVSEDKSSYYEALICQIFEVNTISLTNNFYNQSLIKKRLVMLQKSKSQKTGMMKYLVVIPAVVFSLMLFSTTGLAQEKTANKENKTSKKSEEIPFATLEEIPQFENCSTTKGEEAKKCFADAMNAHINKYFKYPEVALNNNVEGKVLVIFKIDEKGNVNSVETKGEEGTELIQAEAKRIMELLPKFKPGRLNEKPVKVSFAQPIMFRLPPPPPAIAPPPPPKKEK